jgi:hypothetical protein
MAPARTEAAISVNPSRCKRYHGQLRRLHCYLLRCADWPPRTAPATTRRPLPTVTEGTIKVHLHNVYDKLAIRNRTMLALLCASLASAETAGMGNVAALPDQPPGHLQKQSPG